VNSTSIVSMRFFYKYFWVIIFFSCHTAQDNKMSSIYSQVTGAGERFEPADGKAIVFAGQELEAIGGLLEYKDGYFDHFPAPGGFTMYTSIAGGTDMNGEIFSGLGGLTSTINWGDGPENISLQIADPDFKNSCLAIGFDLSNGYDKKVAKGEKDSLLIAFGQWIRALGDRPVFLRIGYEFDGFDWNHYTKENYVAAFRRIRQLFDFIGVYNIAYVWQSKGVGTTQKILDDFYPGDDFVDWCAYSFFTAAEEHHPMIAFARAHNKPLFLAESTPVFLDSNGICKPLDLTKSADAEYAWDNWFVPYFRTINNNPDVVKAFHYINSNWKSRPLWKNNPYFKNIDARIHVDKTLAAKWKEEIGKEKYLNASDSLFEYLWKPK